MPLPGCLTRGLERNAAPAIAAMALPTEGGGEATPMYAVYSDTILAASPPSASTLPAVASSSGIMRSMYSAVFSLVSESMGMKTALSSSSSPSSASTMSSSEDRISSILSMNLCLALSSSSLSLSSAEKEKFRPRERYASLALATSAR